MASHPQGPQSTEEPLVPHRTGCFPWPLAGALNTPHVSTFTTNASSGGRKGMGAQRNLAEVFTEAMNKLAAVAGLVSKLLVPGAGPASPFSGRHLLLLHGNL